MVNAVYVAAVPGQISAAYASGVTGRDFAEEHQINLVLRQLTEWRDSDEPMIEAIGDTLAEVARLDSQEQARRVLDTVIEVLERWRETD